MVEAADTAYSPAATTLLAETMEGVQVDGQHVKQ